MTAYSDAFTRADTAVGAGLGTVPGGPAWLHAWSWRILGNRAYTDSAATDNPIAYIRSGVGNVDMSATISSAGGDALYFRVRDQSNWMRSVIERYSIQASTAYYVTEYEWACVTQSGSPATTEYEWACVTQSGSAPVTTYNWYQAYDHLNSAVSHEFYFGNGEPYTYVAQAYNTDPNNAPYFPTYQAWDHTHNGLSHTHNYQAGGYPSRDNGTTNGGYTYSTSYTWSGSSTSSPCGAVYDAYTTGATRTSGGYSYSTSYSWSTSSTSSPCGAVYDAYTTGATRQQGPYYTTTTTYANRVTLDRCIGGAIARIAAADIPAPSSLRVRAVGSAITAYVSGSANPTLSVTDASFFSDNGHGIGRGNSELLGSNLDNFSFNDLNSGPSAPVVTYPNGGESLNTTHTLTWTSGVDPDGDAVSHEVQLTTDGGSTWTHLNVLAAGTNSYLYDFTNTPASSTCRIRVQARDTSGLKSAWDESNANFSIVHNTAPLSPVLQAPSNNSSVDLAAGYTARWLFRDSVGDTQASYAFRRKIAGAAAYEWWNSTSLAWQGTEFFNTNSDNFVAFAAAKWTNGNVYNWSVATRDPQGLTGLYASDFTVAANAGPTCNVSTVASTSTTTRPVIGWSYSDPENDPQATYLVKIFTSTQYSVGGFDPSTSTAAYTSTTISSVTDRNHQVATDLEQGVQYRAYVQVTGGAQTSPWDFEPFILTLATPAKPVLYVFDSPDYARVRLVVLGKDNILATDDGLGSGTVDASVTKSAVDAEGYFTYTAAATGVRQVKFYAAQAHFFEGEWIWAVDLKNTTASAITLTVDLNGQAASTVTVPANSTTTVSGSKNTSLADATNRYLALTIPASTAILARRALLRRNIDGDVTWTRGGLLGLTTATVEYSDDGLIWAPIPQGTLALSVHQAETFFDYTAHPGRPRQYRAKITGILP